MQALLDNLTARGLDPEVPRLFIVDGAKALSKAIKRTFGPVAAPMAFCWPTVPASDFHGPKPLIQGSFNLSR